MAINNQPINYPKYTCSEKYQREIDRYKKWMDANNRRTNANSPYLTREDVDEYYLQVVEVERVNLNSDSAHAIHRGLQWLSDNIEKGGLIIRDKDDPNSNVNQSLWRRELGYVEWLRVNGETDPHANLPTQVLTFLDHQNVMKKLLAETSVERNWLQFAVSWNTNYATMIRMDSARKIRFCDFVTDGRGYDMGDNCLGLILQKYIHKDQTVQNPVSRARTRRGQRGGNNPASENLGAHNAPISNSGKRIVFMWRHRVVECCGTSMIAIDLFMRLFFDVNMSFLEPPQQPQQPRGQNANRHNVFVQNPGRGRRNRRNNNNVSFLKRD